MTTNDVVGRPNLDNETGTVKGATRPRLCSDMTTRRWIHEAPFNRDTVRLLRSSSLNHSEPGRGINNAFRASRAAKRMVDHTPPVAATAGPAPWRSRRAAGAFEAPAFVVIPRHPDRYTLPQIGFARPASVRAFRRVLAVVAGPYITRAPPGGERPPNMSPVRQPRRISRRLAGIMTRKARVS